MKTAEIIFAIVAVALVAVGAWTVITKPKIGFLNLGWDDTELALPCTHTAAHELAIQALGPRDDKALPSISCRIVARCGVCSIDTSDRFFFLDGRVSLDPSIQQQTEVIIDGEHLALVPRALYAELVAKEFGIDDVDQEMSMPGFGDQSDHDRQFGGDFDEQSGQGV